MGVSLTVSNFLSVTLPREHVRGLVMAEKTTVGSDWLIWDMNVISITGLYRFKYNLVIIIVAGMCY